MTSRALHVFLASILGGFGLLVIVSAVSLARAGDTSAASSQIDNLAADMIVHKQACDKVTREQKTTYERCQNQADELIERKESLGVSDDALNESLNSQSPSRTWPSQNKNETQLPLCPGDPRCK